MNVLIIDDNQYTIKSIEQSLRHLNVECTDVESGEEALELLTEKLKEQHFFHIIFVKLIMPQKDGFTVYREICNLEQELKLPQ